MREDTPCSQTVHSKNGGSCIKAPTKTTNFGNCEQIANESATPFPTDSISAKNACRILNCYCYIYVMKPQCCFSNLTSYQFSETSFLEKSKMSRMNSEKKLGAGRVVAVAIENNKTSQHAAKWAVDNLLPKDQCLLLIHVRQRSSSGSIF